MDALLDRFYKDIDCAVKSQFREYYIKVSQPNSPVFVLVKRRRGNILGDKQKFLFDRLKKISEEIYTKYTLSSKKFVKEYFPYFKLLKATVATTFNFQ